jgi:hypothetical protein
MDHHCPWLNPMCTAPSDFFAFCAAKLVLCRYGL